MDNRVDVRIAGVNDREINQLKSLIEALHSIHYQEFVKETRPWKDYVVSVAPATSSEVKLLLSVILQIIESDRISIDT